MLVNRKSSFSRLFRWIFCNITRFLRVFFLLVDFQQSFCPNFSLPNNRFRTHGTVSNINSRTFDPPVKQRIRRLFFHTHGQVVMCGREQYPDQRKIQNGQNGGSAFPLGENRDTTLLFTDPFMNRRLFSTHGTVENIRLKYIRAPHARVYIIR